MLLYLNCSIRGRGQAGVREPGVTLKTIILVKELRPLIYTRNLSTNMEMLVGIISKKIELSL
jgi:hypothetical protein